MILSALGEVDAAFDVAKGSSCRAARSSGEANCRSRRMLNDAGWRVNTQWLFVPPTGLSRADPRFLPCAAAWDWPITGVVAASGPIIS